MPTLKDFLGFVVNPPPGDPTLTANSDLLPKGAVITSGSSNGQTPVADGTGGYVWQTYAIVPVTPAAWIAPTLINSWANVGAGFETAAYLKDPLGFVHLKGVIQGGATTTVAFVLPSGYRPGNTTQNIAMLGNLAAGGAIEVGNNGNVTALIPSAVSVSLSGITFLAEF